MQDRLLYVGPLPLYPTLEQLSKLDCDSPALRLGARILNVGDCFENFRSRPRTTGYYLSTETLRIAKIKNIDMQWKDIVEGLLGIRERGLVYTVLQEYSYSGRYAVFCLKLKKTCSIKNYHFL